MAAESQSETPNHLVVFLHGHAGHPEDLKYIASELKQRHPHRVITYLATSYKDKTNDGVDVVGQVVAREIKEYISSLKGKGTCLKYISFVGHSMGGLLARYAIGLLYSEKFFDDIDPLNFTTFATPHLGTRKPSTGTWVDRVFNFVAPLVIGRTGSQFFLRDDHDGRPLLVAIAEEDSDYYRALQLFPHKSLYANVTLDYLVPFFTAFISPTDFKGGYPFVSGYDPVIFDVSDGQPTERLELNDHQLAIIPSLNALNWEKYPVHIHGDWNNHTAILAFKVRHQETCEGRVVVRHYGDQFVVAKEQ